MARKTKAEPTLVEENDDDFTLLEDEDNQETSSDNNVKTIARLIELRKQKTELQDRYDDVHQSMVTGLQDLFENVDTEETNLWDVIDEVVDRYLPQLHYLSGDLETVQGSITDGLFDLEEV